MSLKTRKCFFLHSVWIQLTSFKNFVLNTYNFRKKFLLQLSVQPTYFRNKLESFHQNFRNIFGGN